MEWTRIKNDVNGNGRWVCHFTDLENDAESLRARYTLSERYDRAVKAANKVGGRRFHNRSYGGGIVFQAYEHQLADLAARIRGML